MIIYVAFTRLIHPSHPVEYADLAIIDLSKAATTEGRAKLAIELRTALTTHGFFYVINHGYTQAQVKSDKILLHLRILTSGTDREDV